MEQLKNGTLTISSSKPEYECEVCKDNEWIMDPETNTARKCKCAEARHYKRIIESCGITGAFLERNFNNYEIISKQTELMYTYTGDLILDKDGNVAFSPTSKFPIREFPHKDNKIEGCIEIFQMPEKNKDGEVFPNRYILGCDPYDDDASNTMSLGSIFCLDLWTDRLVAEYTGRPMFADGFFEICRKMCIFYNGRLNYENNKKGLFAYFAQNNCLYLLTETLEFLRDNRL